MQVLILKFGSSGPISQSPKGGATKSDEFSEKFQGGAIFNPKIYIADFGNFKQGFSRYRRCRLLVIKPVRRGSSSILLVNFFGTPRMFKRFPQSFFFCPVPKSHDQIGCKTKIGKNVEGSMLSSQHG